MVNMRDMTKGAGMSPNTISLVVDDNGYMSDDMRERVRKAMQALNYVSNELARNLYRDCASLVSVIAPTIHRPLFAMLTVYLQHALIAQELHTMLCFTADKADGEIRYINILR